jgi:hypothetical protein
MAWVIPTLVARVSLGPSKTNLFTNDTISTISGDPALCGARSYSLSPLYNFMSLNGDTLSVQSTNLGDVSSYQVSMTVGLLSYATVLPITINF